MYWRNLKTWWKENEMKFLPGLFWVLVGIVVVLRTLQLIIVLN